MLLSLSKPTVIRVILFPNPNENSIGQRTVKNTPMTAEVHRAESMPS